MFAWRIIVRLQSSHDESVQSFFLDRETYDKYSQDSLLGKLRRDRSRGSRNMMMFWFRTNEGSEASRRGSHTIRRDEIRCWEI